MAQDGGAWSDDLSQTFARVFETQVRQRVQDFDDSVM